MPSATRKRHSPEQIVRKLMTADRLLAEGQGHRGGVPRVAAYPRRPITGGVTSSAA